MLQGLDQKAGYRRRLRLDDSSKLVVIGVQKLLLVRVDFFCLWAFRLLLLPWLRIYTILGVYGERDETL